MKLNITKPVQVEAKVLKVHVKVTDRFGGSLMDANGELLREWDQEPVPDFMPGDHYGDYLILDIDIDTGQILNWRPPSAGELEKAIGGDDD